MSDRGAPDGVKAFALSLDPDALLPPDRYRFDATPADAGTRLLDLARGLASSPAWAAMTDAILVVRTEPPAALAVLGRFSPAEEVLVDALPGQLQTELRRFRYVPWGEVEEDCVRLARRLVDTLGREELARRRFVAIPRGGHVVLGLLAYALGLERDQLAWPTEPSDRVVVVDDAAYSGHRFGQFLQARPGPPVVFAHLYSHPHLRDSLVAAEDRVTAVVAAGDLTDHAPDLLQDDHAAWRERWEERADGAPLYWVGLTDHVCFPWSEPELAIWNPVTGREVAGWRIAPPRAVLGNRAAGPGPDRLQVQPHSTGPLRVAPRVLHGRLDGRVVVADLESGRVLRLDGVAGEIWDRVTRGADIPRVVRELGAEYDVDAAELREHAHGLVRSLTEGGILVERDRGD